MSQPRRCQTALRGRPVATSAATDCHRHGDAPETSPFRTTGYSKRWLDPRRVTNGTGHTPRNRDLGRVWNPGPSASAQLVSGSVGGPHRCSIASDLAMSQPGAGVGANPIATGSGHTPQRGHTGSRPREQAPFERGRPFRPSSAHSSPRRSGVSQCHLPMSFPLQGVLVLASPTLASDSALSLIE